jgi:halocyanin-like protein
MWSQHTRRAVLGSLATAGLGSLAGCSGILGPVDPAGPDADPESLEGGDVYWAFETNGVLHSAPTVVDGTVYFGSRDRHVYAVDAEDGTERWHFATGPSPRGPGEDLLLHGTGVWSSPQVIDGTVYVASNDTNLYALDAETGDPEWVFEEPTAHLYSSPTFVDGTVYFCSRHSHVYAVDAATGERVWRSDTFGSSGASPTVTGGTVYAASYAHDHNGGGVMAFDAATGDREWAVEGPESCSSPTVVNGTAYIGSLDGHLYALDAATGDREWRFELDKMMDQASPTVHDGVVYAGSYGEYLWALDAATGEVVWQAEDQHGGLLSPTVAGGRVFFMTQDGRLSAFDADTGDVTWSVRLHDGPDGIMEASPIVVDGVVYVGTRTGSLFAVEAGVDGSSEGSRVASGTLNHHHSWADVQADADAPALEMDTAGTRSTSAPELELAPPEFERRERGYGGWFSDVESYDGTVDLRGREAVTVLVGAGQVGTAFEPAAALVDDGTTVTFEWTGRGGTHNVVFDRGPEFETDLTDAEGHAEALELSPPDGTGWAPYYCEPHQGSGMRGAVVVGDPDEVDGVDPEVVPAGDTG